MLVGYTVGARLMAAHEVLERTITSLKTDVIPGPEGIQHDLGLLGVNDDPMPRCGN